MEIRLRGLCGLASILVIALVAAAPAGATVSAPSEWSFADTQATDDLTLQLALASGCPLPVKERGTTTKAKALAAGQKLLTRKSKKGDRAFRRSKSFKTPIRADYAMMIAATNNEPGAALEAALRAVQLKPTRLRLLNASELLTDVGLPREALALASAAGKLKPAAASAMGIGTGADIALAKGNALIALGKYPAAITALTAAAGNELESEAQGSLAIANVCNKSIARAKKPAKRSARRQNVRIITAPAPDTTERADPRDVLDLSKGVDQPFAAYAVPGTASRMIALADTIKADYDAATAHEGDLIGQVNAAEITLDYKKVHGPSLSGLRGGDLRTYDFSWDYRYPALQKAIDDANAAEAAAEPPLQGDGSGMWCERHTQGKSALQQVYDANRAFSEAQYQFDTGVAANAADPQLHAYLILRARSNYAIFYTAALQRISYWAAFEKSQNASGTIPACGGMPTTEDGPVAPGDPAASPACPASLNAIKIESDLGPIKIKANCEKFEVESEWGAFKDDAFNLDPAKVKGDLAWIGAFVGVEHKFKDHSTTIFAGPKGKLGFGNVAGELKDGIYIKVGAKGTIDDYGFRVKIGAKTKLGPDGNVTLTHFDDTMDFTLKGSFGCGIWRGC